MVYLSAPFLMTLNDPNPYFKVMVIFDAVYIVNGTRQTHIQAYVG